MLKSTMTLTIPQRGFPNAIVVPSPMPPGEARTVRSESVAAYAEVLALGSAAEQMWASAFLAHRFLLWRDLVSLVLLEQSKLFDFSAGCFGSGSHSFWSFHRALLSFISDVLGVLPGRKVESES